MSLALLGSVSLGLQYIWGPSRRLRGIRIDIHSESGAPLDAKHLLQVVQESFRGPMPILILSSRDFSVIKRLLATVSDEKLWVELPALALETDLNCLSSRSKPSYAAHPWSGLARPRSDPIRTTPCCTRGKFLIYSQSVFAYPCGRETLSLRRFRGFRCMRGKSTAAPRAASCSITAWTSRKAGGTWAGLAKGLYRPIKLRPALQACPRSWRCSKR